MSGLVGYVRHDEDWGEQLCWDFYKMVGCSMIKIGIWKQVFFVFEYFVDTFGNRYEHSIVNVGSEFSCLFFDDFIVWI